MELRLAAAAGENSSGASNVALAAVVGEDAVMADTDQTGGIGVTHGISSDAGDIAFKDRQG
jgi:hypothetical protein